MQANLHCPFNRVPKLWVLILFKGFLGVINPIGLFLFISIAQVVGERYIVVIAMLEEVLTVATEANLALVAEQLVCH